MSNRIMPFLKQWPLHLLLLPLFFILSTTNQYAGLIPVNDALLITVCIAASLLILFAILLRIYKNRIKAAVATTSSGFLYLFFGDIKAIMANSDVFEFISHYKTFLPLLAIVFLLLLYKLYKAPPPYILNLFLNTLFAIYLLIEVFRLTQLSQQKHNEEWIAASKGSVTPTTSLHPDIYYILLDCYPNTSYQQDQLGVDSNELDTYLSKKGFYLVKKSRSNYNYTSFSMASTFNMNYLDWLKNVSKVKAFHYNKTLKMVEKAAVFNTLEQEQYNFINLSIFDLHKNPSVRKEDFLTATSSHMILYNTFYNCLYRDVIPELFPSVKAGINKKNKKNKRDKYDQLKGYNSYVIDSLLAIHPAKASKGPMFAYAHLILPHFPYFFDSTGKSYPEELVYGPDMITNKERFKNYIGYTNQQVSVLLDSIIHRSDGEAIIIVQSDHGLFDLAENRYQNAFRNYSAFYFPDRDYKLLYDSMSNVNTFRIIFNKYFDQQLPLLKDSSIFIK